ncbi:MULTISPECIES: hypothetical protein [unclassified Mycobacterium]|uniref:hypothetical protein n=1 Tax=unclassified Mycobacterium TaxID=2642494 RepID=UPI001116851E|nr:MULTISPECIES: hypothetical protein [unclassified Mycobacterium]
MPEYPYRDEEVDDRDQARDCCRHVVGNNHLSLVMAASHQEALPRLPAATSPVVKPRMTPIHQVTRNSSRYRHEQDTAQDHP